MPARAISERLYGYFPRVGAGVGRKRTIDRSVTMDAIEAVVRQHGVAGLSIDAVAREAGISKSSVVYDFESKDQLLAAFIRRQLDQKKVDMNAAAAQYEGQPDALMRGMIDVCMDRPTDEDIACAMAITASFANDNTCREMMGTSFIDDLNRVMAEAADPRRARLAWAALHGVMSLEYLGFHAFPPDERRQILTDIASLLSDPPAAT